MIDDRIYAQIRRIQDPALRQLAEKITALVLENWGYVLFLLFLWRFPHIIADLTDTEVTPRRPTGDSVFWQSEMARALSLACLAMSYNLLFGFSGVISFGHALFFGTGGYVTFMLLADYDAALQTQALIVVLFVILGLALFTKIEVRTLLITALIAALLILVLMPTGDNISFYQAAVLAVLASIALSLLSGFVTLRLRGIYFTMFTLALAEMFWVLAKSGTFRNVTGAEDGLGFRELLPEALNPTPTADGSRLHMYYATVVFFVIVFLAVRRYLNSPAGRVMQAIRENEERARTIGYNTLFYKLLTMSLAGTIATLSGLFFVIWATDKRVHPETLSLKYTVDPMLHTLIGGAGTLTGPIIATLGVTLGESYLRKETFTLHTSLFGLVSIWQLAVLLIVALLTGYWGRYVPAFVDRLGQRTGRARQQAIIMAQGALFAGLLIVGSILGDALSHSDDLATQEFAVSDLWDLGLGIVFVLVVIVLPYGVVGTWRRFWAERRIRQIERQLQTEKSA